MKMILPIVYLSKTFNNFFYFQFKSSKKNKLDRLEWSWTIFGFSNIQSATFANFRVTIKQLIFSAADSRIHLEPA